MEEIHFQIVESLLSSIYKKGDTLLSSFMFGKPGSPIWDRSRGTEIYVDRKSYTRALLFMRKNGASYLRAISISDLWSMVTSFLTENFWYIGESSWLSSFDGSYSSKVSIENKYELARILADSPMFSPDSQLSLYPLVAVRVSESINCSNFFLISPESLGPDQLPPLVVTRILDPASFPPFRDWDGPRRSPSAWLGVRSPLVLVSDKMKAAILGALALTPLSGYRYMQSGRKVFGGRCTVANGYLMSGSDEPHVPPLMEDLTVRGVDHAWLRKLSDLLGKEDKSSRSQIRSLEYYYRAWFLNPRERFPALCMALDSVVGVNHGHTAEAVKLVANLIGPSVDIARLRLLMRIRGAVIHGAAPDVYDSENYAQYYVEYGVDPIRDMEIIVAKCLRDIIFLNDLVCQPDPHKTTVEKLQAKGRLPKDLSGGAIIPNV